MSGGPMILPALDEECVECGGTGGVGGIRTANFMQSPRECPRCGGRKRTPTETGRAVLEFLLRHGSVLR